MGTARLYLLYAGFTFESAACAATRNARLLQSRVTVVASVGTYCWHTSLSTWLTTSASRPEQAVTSYACERQSMLGEHIAGGSFLPAWRILQVGKTG